MGSPAPAISYAIPVALRPAVHAPEDELTMAEQ
jgi:hypothetical protein